MTTIVKPVTKDHITITLDADNRVVWFNLANGGAEIVVLDKNGTECTRLAVLPPEPGYQLRIATQVPNVVDIIYQTKETNGTR